MTLQCDMTDACAAAVTHVDNHGFIYCTKHGIERRTFEPCRKLRPHEIKKMERAADQDAQDLHAEQEHNYNADIAASIRRQS